MSGGPLDVKTMADLLRRGATLTELSCPACSSPLFRMRNGDLWCAQCQKPVIVVKEGAPETEVARPLLFSALESTILAKIQEVEKEIKGETGLERLEKLNAILSSLLENLERVRKVGKR